MNNNGNLDELVKQARENRKNLRESIASLQESLDVLRVHVKYQTFDLEATRREKEALRELLEKRGEIE